MNLDQYYTKHDVAARCLEGLKKELPWVVGKHFIEPSAGDGSFYSILPPARRTGIDLDPRMEGIKRADFLGWNPPKKDTKNYVIIGNPPFGKRSSLAVDFFNHSAEMADAVAFIVPRQFQKYSVHSKLAKDFRLITDRELPDDAFRTPEGKDYSVRTVFQIWTRRETEHQNLRILTPPPTHHDDFEMYQYNNTPQALKVFDEDWDFAVPRQGYEDYGRREFDKRCCELRKQWILFKAKTFLIGKRLFDLDYASLARRNTVVYGFGKADVVMEYRRIYGA
jgi:predicted RNA methylase